MEAMKKTDLIKVFGTGTALAEFFGIERQAVSQWDEEIPELRQYQLRERLPNIDKVIATMNRRQS